MMKFLKLSLLLSLLTACQQTYLPLQSTQQRIMIQSDAGLNHVSQRIVNNMFAIYDKNGDQLLDKNEIKIPLMIRLLDKNGDKALSPEELHTPLATKIISGIIRKSSNKIFDLADRDDNGYLSYREFIVTRDMDNKALKLYFRLTDDNLDNKIDKSEYEDFIAEAIAVAGEGIGGFPFTSRVFQKEVE